MKTSCNLSMNVAYQYLESDVQSIKNAQLLSHLKASSLLILSIHREHENTKNVVTGIRTNVEQKL